MLVKESVNRLLAKECAMQYLVYSDHHRSEASSVLCDEEAHAVDWARRDVMVGTVRSSEQLRFCLETGGYYAPARVLSDQELQVQYVALHEHEVGELTGIQRYGAIRKIYKLNRSRIPVPMHAGGRPDEVYYYFEVEKWELLPECITIKDSFKGKPAFTNQFLLKHCSRSYQLFSVSSEDDWMLMSALYRGLLLLSEAASDEYAEIDGLFGAYSFVLLDRCFLIRNERGACVYSSLLERMLCEPRTSFQEIRTALGLL